MKKLIFKFLASLILSLSCCLGLQAKTYIVAVGISDYIGTDCDLNLCAYDAQCIKKAFENNSDVSVVLLTDSEATDKNMTRALQNTFSQSTEDDVILFFFSGHGYPGGFLSYNKGALFYDTIRKIMAKSKARSKLIFADACHSGMIRTPKKFNPAKEEEAKKKSEVMLFLSSRQDEKSLEYSNLPNGLFTYFLLQGLSAEADANKNGEVEALELFNYVYPRVINYSKGRQHPNMWGKFADELLVLRLDNANTNNSNLNNVNGSNSIGSAANASANSNGNTESTVANANNSDNSSSSTGNGNSGSVNINFNKLNPSNLSGKKLNGVTFVNDSTGVHIYHNNNNKAQENP